MPRGTVLRIVGAAGAGFPSPAQDWEDNAISLIELPTDPMFEVECAARLITSYAERATDDGASKDHLMRQADFVAELLIARFNLSEVDEQERGFWND